MTDASRFLPLDLPGADRPCDGVARPERAAHRRPHRERRPPLAGGLRRRRDRARSTTSTAASEDEPDDCGATFWRDSGGACARCSFPFLWTVVAAQGQLFGDQPHGSVARVTNGFDVLLSRLQRDASPARPDPRIDSNEFGPEPQRHGVRVAERPPDAAAAASRVFATWGVFNGHLQPASAATCRCAPAGTIADARRARRRATQLLNTLFRTTTRSIADDALRTPSSSRRSSTTSQRKQAARSSSSATARRTTGRTAAATTSSSTVARTASTGSCAQLWDDDAGDAAVPRTRRRSSSRPTTAAADGPERLEAPRRGTSTAPRTCGSPCSGRDTPALGERAQRGDA